MSDFIFASKTDRTKSAHNIDCVHLVHDAGEFAYVIAPRATFEQPEKLLDMDTKLENGLSYMLQTALELAHGRSLGMRGVIPVGRVRRPFANDVDVMYLDDFDDLVKSL